MTFGQFLSILKARWWAMLAVLVLTVGTALGVSLLLPKKYTASASVVVDFKPDPLSASLYAGMPPTALMATQVDIIGSDRVALKVVKNLKLTENPEVRSQWLEATNGEGSLEQWLASNFQRQLDVKPSRESSVITVAYSAPDPRFAAGLANAFVQAYVETVLELRVDPARQYNNFFDTRAKEAREALERAQAKLSEYQKENGLIATDERFDVENQRLNELSSQLVALQALASETRSRSAQASGESGTQIQEVINNPLVSGLKADLSRAEAKLHELNARLGVNHPAVIEAKASTESLRNRIEQESRRVAGGVGLNANVSSRRLADVQAAYNAQRSTVLKMKAVRDEASVLVRDAENAQRAFEAINQRLNQTSLESQTQQSNVNILSAAAPPSQPSSPKILLNTALAVFLGSLLAVGSALMMELTDRRVRSSRDVVDTLGLPLIGVLPGATKKLRGKKSKAAIAQQQDQEQRVISGRRLMSLKFGTRSPA
ncbi:chain length determinant protein EpsF [Piscinibacter sakaiensis]|uniref:chain length determinant protein EpsF n=1 Tax=Piscinibacter sakaiensis TaxID=1547922 RepID=UPI003AAD5FDC